MLRPIYDSFEVPCALNPKSFAVLPSRSSLSAIFWESLRLRVSFSRMNCSACRQAATAQAPKQPTKKAEEWKPEALGASGRRVREPMVGRRKGGSSRSLGGGARDGLNGRLDSPGLRKLSDWEAGLGPEAGRRAQDAGRRASCAVGRWNCLWLEQDGEATASGPPLPGIRDSSPSRHGPAGDCSAGPQLPAGRCHTDF